MDLRRITSHDSRGASPYSDAVVAQGFVYLSGHTPTDNSRPVDDGDLRARARDMFQRMARTLDAAGSSSRSVIHVNLYITAVEDFSAVSDEFARFFDGFLPARTTTCVDLCGMLMEANAVAVRDAEA